MTNLQILVRHPVKARRIKYILHSRCEVCGYEGMQDELEIHTIIEGAEIQYGPPDLERYLLLVCSHCHADIHLYTLSADEQMALARIRPDPIREEIRTILAFRPKPYDPPEVDLEEIYREASAAQHFRYAC